MSRSALRHYLAWDVGVGGIKGKAGQLNGEEPKFYL